jgi:hypothetical protein
VGKKRFGSTRQYPLTYFVRISSSQRIERGAFERDWSFENIFCAGKSSALRLRHSHNQQKNAYAQVRKSMLKRCVSASCAKHA